MKKKLLAIIFLSILSFSLSSLVVAFDNKANYVNPSDPNDKRQRPYTRENAGKPYNKNNQEGYLGGHDTFIAEGMLLKQEVHRGDSDSGEKFNKWVENDNALPTLRIGEHDEDTTKSVNVILNDPPINDWGSGVFHQFYNPDTGKGLWGNKSAMSVAGDYAKEVFKKAGCKAGGINSLTAEEKKKVGEVLETAIYMEEKL